MNPTTKRRCQFCKTHNVWDHVLYLDANGEVTTYPARVVEVESVICLSCKSVLPLGPSNDTPEVLVEVRAQELADPSYNVANFTQAEWMGWNGDEEYVMCGQHRTVWDDMNEQRFAGWEAGGLAAEIAGAVNGVLPRNGGDDE